MGVGLRFRIWMPVSAVLIVLLSIALMFLYGVPAVKARLTDSAQNLTTRQALATAEALSEAEGEQDIQSQLTLSAEATGGETVVVDRQGQIVAREGSAGDFEPSQEMLQNASDGSRMVDRVDGVNVAVIPILSEGTLTGGLVFASDEEIAGYQLFLSSGLEAAGIASVLGSGLMLLLATFLSQRVERLTRGARSIEQGDLSHRIKPGFNDELGELAKTFNTMAARLQDSFTHLEERVAERTAQLEAEHARLDAVLRQMPSGVVIAEAPSGQILLSNERAGQIRGYPLPSNVGFDEYSKLRGFRPNGQPYEPEDWPLVRSIRAGEEVVGEEIVVPRGEGSWGTMLVNSSPIRDRDGRIAAGVAVFYDITEQKRAEEALRESEERYRVVAETASDAIVMIDEDSQVLFVNSAAEKIFGYTRVELLGQQLTMVMPRHLREAHRASLKRYVDTGRKRLQWDSIQLPGLHKSGKEIPLEVSFGEFVKEGERFFTGFLRDITERKQAEEEILQLNKELEQRVQQRTAQLEEERATLNVILDNLTEGVLATNSQGRVVFANRTARSMLNVGGEEPLKKLPDLWKDLNLPEAMSRCASTQECIEAQIQEDNTLLRLVFEYMPAFDDHKGGVLAIIRDLSEGRRLEASQQRFLANAAHELKTPLTTILGASEYLLIEYEDDPETRHRLLNHIFSEALRMQRLSETLLRLARTGVDLRDPELEVVDLDGATREAAERMKPLAESAGVDLRVEGRGGACVRADHEWLEQALLVVLGNAVQHSERGGEVRLRVEDGAVTVEDEGAGINQADLPYVFERFYRGKRSSGGFGLGLAICKDLVERMGGSISLESKEGAGTKVSISCRR